jgi:ABC-2 type transport system permease protein
MRAYRKLASIALQQTVAYRSGFFLGLMGPAFFLLAMLYLWRTLLSNHTAFGMTWEEMRAYVIITFICGNLVSMWTDFSIANKVRDGSIALDLTKPIDYQRARLSETLGVAGFELTNGILVGGTIVALFGGARPHGWAAWVFFPISLLLVVPLKFCISYITGLACFWTQNYFGVSMARQAIVNLLSGGLAPLRLVPQWFQVGAALLPFQAIASIPALIFIGKPPLWVFTDRTGWEVDLMAVGLQAIWVVVMIFVSRGIFAFAIRKLTVHGG